MSSLQTFRLKFCVHFSSPVSVLEASNRHISVARYSVAPCCFSFLSLACPSLSSTLHSQTSSITVSRIGWETCHNHLDSLTPSSRALFEKKTFISQSKSSPYFMEDVGHYRGHKSPPLVCVSWTWWLQSTFHIHTNEEEMLWVSVWLMEAPLKSSIVDSPDFNEHHSLPQASQYFTVGRLSRRQLLRAPRPKQWRCNVRTSDVELWILYYTVPSDVESIEVVTFGIIKCCITTV